MNELFKIAGKLVEVEGSIFVNFSKIEENKKKLPSSNQRLIDFIISEISSLQIEMERSLDEKHPNVKSMERMREHLSNRKEIDEFYSCILLDMGSLSDLTEILKKVFSM